MTNSTVRPKIAVIGAGLAAVTFAREIHSLADVSLFEKSRGIGGRMSVRREGDLSFDHGAQFFTARSPEFQSTIAAAINKEVIVEWTPKVVTLEIGRKTYKREWFEPHYRGVTGMNSLVKSLAENLHVHFSFQVECIEKVSEGWAVIDESGGKEGPFDWVVSAAPAPQTARLLPSEFTEHGDISTAMFSACFAIMLQFESSIVVNFDAAIAKHPVLSWLASGDRKTNHGNHRIESMLIHSNNAWASENIDAELSWIESRMQSALEELLPQTRGQVAHISTHRWRYAKCEQAAARDYLLDNGNQLAAIGDWCRGGRIEDAFQSGHQLAKALTRSLK